MQYSRHQQGQVVTDIAAPRHFNVLSDLSNKLLSSIGSIDHKEGRFLTCFKFLKNFYYLKSLCYYQMIMQTQEHFKAGTSCVSTL